METREQPIPMYAERHHGAPYMIDALRVPIGRT